MLDEIKAHYLAHFGHCIISKDFPDGPFPFSLMLFGPSEERPGFTVTTLGLSQKKQQTTAGLEGYERIELLIYFPKDWGIDLTNRKLPSTWACLFLFYAANYIIDKNIFMHIGSVVHTEENRPAAVFRFPYAIFTPPLMEQPGFFPLDVDGTEIEFCSLILITQAEADFMKENGFTKLIKEMTDQQTYDCVINPTRSCTFGARNARAKEKLAQATEAAENSIKTGCVISTAVFLAVCCLIGSDTWQKSAPFGLGIAVFVITLIAGIAFPKYYAKSKRPR